MILLITLLSACLFYLVPICIGTVVISVFNLVLGQPKQPNRLYTRLENSIQKIRIALEKYLLGKKTEVSEFPLVLHAVYPFAVGSIVLLAVAQFTKWLTDSGISKDFSSTFFPCVYLLAFVGCIIWLYRLFQKRHQIELNLGVVTLILGLSILTFTIWQWRSPYPLNWDLYEHQTLSTLIQQGQYDFSTSQISDTFGFASYPPTFHLLLATSQFGLDLTPSTVLNYWNILSFIHLVSVSAASYFFALSITKNKYLASLSCIIGTLVFESVIAFTSLFILPQTVAATLWVLLLARMIYSFYARKQVTVLEVLISATTLIFFHFVIGSLAAGLYLASYLFLRFQNFLLEPKILKALWLIVGLACLAGITASIFIDLSALNQGEASLYSFPLDEKWKYIRQIYGLSILIAPLGFWYFWKQRERLTAHLLLFLLVPLIAIVISNFPYVFKFLTLARFPAHVLMAAGFWYLFHQNRLRTFLITCTGLLFVFMLASNTNQWQHHVRSYNQVTHLSPDDLEAAQFLRTTYTGQEVLIVSDPSTGYLMEGLSGINSAGGAFATRENRLILAAAGKSIFQEQSLASLKQTTDAITSPPQKYLLVLSGRSFRWLIADEQKQLSFDYNIWQPEPFSGYNQYLLQSLLKENPTARQVFKNDSLAVIEF